MVQTNLKKRVQPLQLPSRQSTSYSLPLFVHLGLRTQRHDGPNAEAISPGSPLADGLTRTDSFGLRDLILGFLGRIQGADDRLDCAFRSRGIVPDMVAMEYVKGLMIFEAMMCAFPEGSLHRRRTLALSHLAAKNGAASLILLRQE
jgi:hypothetical protein